MDEKLLKVRLGIDPSDDNIGQLLNIKKVLKSFLPKKNVRIIPTYVMGFEGLGFFKSLSIDEKRRAKDDAYKQLKAIVDRIEADNWDMPEIHGFDKTSKRGSVRALSEFLIDEKCDLFVANTHARKGLKRAFMGSFSENLLLQTKIPMLFISPEMKAKDDIQNIVFPTNFMDLDFQLYKDFLESKYYQNRKIHIFSKALEFPTPVSIYEQGGHSVAARYVEDLKNSKLDKLKKWKEYSAEKNIAIVGKVTAGINYLYESLESYSRDISADLIVMATYVKKGDLIFSGSFTREVVRNSKLPVLVWNKSEEV